MEQSYIIAGTPEVRIAVRVRGLSHEPLYFDEDTSTIRVTKEFIVIRLRIRVDLDIDLHVTNMRTHIGGIYRVAWINTRPVQGLYAVGLELLDAEGEIWESDLIPEGLNTGEAAPSALLECQRCYQRVSMSVPEALTESLGEGFTIAHHCETCKATTGWVYTPEKPPAPGSGDATKPATDHRQKGRAPIRLAVKIIRTKHGMNLFDISETMNVSRTGIYFTTEQGYEVGENVEVVLPYHPDSMAIPVPARVVRREERAGTCQKGIALQLSFGSAQPL